MSLESLSARTRLPVATLQAIERGGFSELPGEAYARGFVCQIGQELGLDVDVLRDAYEVERARVVEPQPLPTVQTPAWLAEATVPARSGLTPAQVFVAVVALAAALAFMLSARHREAPQVAHRAARVPAAASAEAGPPRGGDAGRASQPR